MVGTGTLGAVLMNPGVRSWPRRRRPCCRRLVSSPSRSRSRLPGLPQVPVARLVSRASHFAFAQARLHPGRLEPQGPVAGRAAPAVLVGERRRALMWVTRKKPRADQKAEVNSAAVESRGPSLGADLELVLRPGLHVPGGGLAFFRKILHWRHECVHKSFSS